jgi:hypothetical protein
MRHEANAHFCNGTFCGYDSESLVPVPQWATMLTSRVLLFIAAVCLGFAVWTVHVSAEATYQTYVGSTYKMTIASSTCPSVWDRWTDHLPPAPIPEPTSISNEVGPTTGELKASACGRSIVGQEHITESWASGALLALIAAGFTWLKFDQ